MCQLFHVTRSAGINSRSKSHPFLLTSGPTTDLTLNVSVDLVKQDSMVKYSLDGCRGDIFLQHLLLLFCTYSVCCCQLSQALLLVLPPEWHYHLSVKWVISFIKPQCYFLRPWFQCLHCLISSHISHVIMQDLQSTEKNQPVMVTLSLKFTS